MKVLIAIQRGVCYFEYVQKCIAAAGYNIDTVFSVGSINKNPLAFKWAKEHGVPCEWIKLKELSKSKRRIWKQVDAVIAIGESKKLDKIMDKAQKLEIPYYSVGTLLTFRFDVVGK